MLAVDAGRSAIGVVGKLISSAASIAVHALLFLWILHVAQSDSGLVKQQSEAISVEMVATQVLDAVDAQQMSEASASSAAMAAGAEVSEEIKQTTDDPVQLKSLTPELTSSPPEANTPSQEAPLETVEARSIEAISGAADTSDAITAERIDSEKEVEMRQAPAKTRPRDTPAKTHSKAEPKEVRSPPKKSEQHTAQKVPGGKPQVSSRGKQGSSGKVSASRGDIASYSAMVRARVASRRPGGGGQRGTVVISFSVTRSGGIGSASVSRSSGNGSLDSMVLSAVRGAGPFPPPPGGAGGLRFAVPFYFR